jgi:hypothetical protein
MAPKRQTMHEKWLVERAHILQRIADRKAKEAAQSKAKAAVRKVRKPNALSEHLRTLPPQARNPYAAKRVYLMANREHGLFKIGYTWDVAKRRKDIEREIPIPFPIEVVSTWDTYHFQELEATLHRTVADKRVKGEWFKLSAEDVKEVFRFAEEWLEKNPSADAA